MGAADDWRGEEVGPTGWDEGRRKGTRTEREERESEAAVAAGERLEGLDGAHIERLEMDMVREGGEFGGVWMVFGFCFSYGI